MTNVFVRDVLYLLLIFIEFLLKLVFTATNCVLFTVKLLLQQVINVNMIETSKKRKRNPNDQHNQTVAVRGVIDANWQKLLSSTLLMDKKTEKSAQEDNKDVFTAPFRRARKKKAKDEVSSAAQNVETLNLAQESHSATDDEQKINARNDKRNKITKFLAMDCEMVGVGYDGNDHMLARVSVVNKFGDCVYDKFVKAREEVKDYRTSVSGVRKEDMLNGEDFMTVQKEVAELIKGRILVGHSLKNDMSVLFLSHPKKNIRDTSRYKPFRKVSNLFLIVLKDYTKCFFLVFNFIVYGSCEGSPQLPQLSRP